MEIPIGDAQARFAEAIEAAERGEQVVVTRDGKPVAEIISPRQSQDRLDFARLEARSKQFGFDEADMPWPPEFDDPAFSRRVLGLDD